MRLKINSKRKSLFGLAIIISMTGVFIYSCAPQEKPDPHGDIQNSHAMWGFTSQTSQHN